MISSSKSQVHKGSLFVRDSFDISTLQPLSSLITIEGGTLGIDSNLKLLSLSGFHNLQRIDGGLWLNFNSQLETLNGLDGVASVGVDQSNGLSISIERNDQLSSIIGLQGITGVLVGALRIYRNPKLTSLHGLEGIIGVSGFDVDNGLSIYIGVNNLLQTLTGLSNVEGALPGALEIERNGALESMQGLLGIHTAGTHRLYYKVGLSFAKNNPLMCITPEELKKLREMCRVATTLYGSVDKPEWCFGDKSASYYWGPHCQSELKTPRSVEARTHSTQPLPAI